MAEVLRAHGLLGLTNPSWEHLGLDEQGRRELAGRVRMLGITALRRVPAAATVRDALAAADVPAIFFKGVALSQVVWGNATARGAGDIDVVVPEGLLNSAARALTEIGARPRPVMADVRPRARDRQMHHAVTFRFNDIDIDVHYRLDPMPEVLPLAFESLFDQSCLVTVSGEQLRTFNDEFALFVLAAGAGRDNWRKWGQVLEFAHLHRRVGVGADTAAQARSLGLGHRFDTGLALSEAVTGQAAQEVSRTARSIATTVLGEHARGVAGSTWQMRTRQLSHQRQRTRSIGTGSAYRWSASRLLWPDDGVGRPPEAGIGLDVRITSRRVISLLARRGRAAGRPLEPPTYLCDLVDEAARGGLDQNAFVHLEAALRQDRLSRQDLALLPLLAPLVERDLPDHRFAGIVAGLRRQARVRVAAAESLAESAARSVPGQALVLGDLGAARIYPDPAQRQVLSSLLVVPLAPSTARALADEVAARTDATIDGDTWPVLVRLGTRLMLHRSIGGPFDFPAARALLDTPSLELQLYDSIVRCARGAPLILWYSDAVNAGEIDWRGMLDIAHQAGWVWPVVQAMRLMHVRGYDVPLTNDQDALLDELYWHSSGRWSSAALRRVRTARRRQFPGD